MQLRVKSVPLDYRRPARMIVRDVVHGFLRRDVQGFARFFLKVASFAPDFSTHFGSGEFSAL